MMFHPSAVTQVGSSSYALDALEFVFTGRAAHAASSPEKGINALDGAIFLFNGINALREHLPDDVRIHGIISEGEWLPTSFRNGRLLASTSVRPGAGSSMKSWSR